MLEKPEWKNDIWPEIMDGKNVFDYVDPDILQKLEKLELEEEEYYKSQENQMDQDDESSDLSEDLLAAHADVEKNKKIIKKKHELAKNSTLPRKVRDLTESEKFMQDVRSEKKDIFTKMKNMSANGTKDRREKLRETLKKEAKKDDEEEEFDGDSEQMDIEEEGNNINNTKPRKSKKKTENEHKRIIEKEKTQVIQRMKNKLQKSWNRHARVNDADRSIAGKLPIHLNTGKRGKGKTDWR
jgi:nucleolar GTP-binding protein